MAHSRNEIIREGVETEVQSNDWTFHTSDAGAVDEEAIVDLVMRHVDPLVVELAAREERIRELEQGVEITNLRAIVAELKAKETATYVSLQESRRKVRKLALKLQHLKDMAEAAEEHGADHYYSPVIPIAHLKREKLI